MNASLPFAAPLVSLLLIATLPAHAQAHQAHRGACTLRSSTVDARSIPPDIAAKHGFSATGGNAVVNVTVRCKASRGNGTVPAEISVTRRDAAGTKEPIEMQLDRENGYVSYYGTYPRLAGATVTLTVSALPRGLSKPITLVYRDRFSAR